MSRDRCPVCECYERKYVRKYREQSDVFCGLALVECQCCGLVAAAPMPDPIELERYNSGYWKNAHSLDPRSASPLEVAFRSGMAQVRSRVFLEYSLAQAATLNSILEIGPGDGSFAECVMQKVPACTYFVLESDSTMHDRLSSAGVHVLHLQEMREIPGDFVDAIILSHVLEHVGNPIDVLHQAIRILRRGGVLYIDVPCRDDLHKVVDEPHVLFFNQDSIRFLLKPLPLENIQVRNFGIPLRKLTKRTNATRKFLSRVRNSLLRRGFLLGAGRRSGLSAVDTRLQRAVLRPMKPHVETLEPAWWIRVFATRD